MNTTADVPQCTAIITSTVASGRGRRCNRRASKKSGYRYCGQCAAALVVRCGVVVRNGQIAAIYHKPDCAGCKRACCRDRSLCTDICVDDVRMDANGRLAPVRDTH